MSRVGDGPMDDATLLDGFEGRTLPKEAWTHRSHVRVAWIYLRRHGLDGAIDRMRAGIRALNETHGVATSPGRGYSETVTVCFLRLIHSAMSAYDGHLGIRTSDAFCDAHPHLLHSTVMRLFYSPAGRDLEREVSEFVEPDLAALPRATGGPGSPPGDPGRSQLRRE